MPRTTHENHQSAETRQRLLDAAGALFAEQGYNTATVRDICAKARANVAAMNYHFGGKEGMYLAVLRHSHQCALGQADRMAAEVVHQSPEKRLAAFIRGFLANIFAEGAPAWHGRLVTREMAEPTGALDELVRQNIRPRAVHLESIVRELMGKGARQDQIDFCSRSVIGQMIFYFHARPVVERLFPGFDYGPAGVARMADHVTRFSLAGIRNYRASAGSQP